MAGDVLGECCRYSAGDIRQVARSLSNRGQARKFARKFAGKFAGKFTFGRRCGGGAT